MSILQIEEDKSVREFLLRGVELVEASYNDTTAGYGKFQLLIDNMASIVVTEASVDIGFRGTEFHGLKDILTDADVKRFNISPYLNSVADLPYEEVFVHHGGWMRKEEIFNDPKAYSNLKKAFVALRDLTEITINIYGHSMGCWVAQLFFLDQRLFQYIKESFGEEKLKDLKINIRLGLFASPGLITKDTDKTFLTPWMDKMNESFNLDLKILSLANVHDIVPILPVGYKQLFSQRFFVSNTPKFDELENHSISMFKPLIEHNFRA